MQGFRTLILINDSSILLAHNVCWNYQSINLRVAR